MITTSTRPLLATCLLLLTSGSLTAVAAAETPGAYPHFSGIYPHLAALADSYTEAGIGAVVPWADRLWYVSYVAHKSGSRVGLFEITPELTIRRRPESIVGTHAGRMIHRESNQLIIGPYVIDAEGDVRVLEHLARNERVTAIARHLKDPANKVYVQAMEGKYYEVDVHTLETTLLGDARAELGIRGAAHFKGAYTAQGRYVVANNSYDSADARRGSGDGRLAEWDGQQWRIIHRTAFCDVTTAAGVDAAPGDTGPLYATGWDKRSVLLAVLTDGSWTTYRLPKGSQAYDHAWCTEWPRIRQVRSGRLMLDMHGLFYEMSPQFKAGNAGGLSPLAYHLRMTPDFCNWRGRLVLAGDQNSSMQHRHRTGGQPQSNLWFGSLEELRRWGDPAGWGGPWLDDQIQAGVPSEPFLLRDFTRRSLHLVQGANHGKTESRERVIGSEAANTTKQSAKPESRQTVFTLEVDRDGTGHWSKYKTVELPPDGYAYHVLPDELPGCWMRITSDRDTTASAQFIFGPRERRGNGGDRASLFRSLSGVAEDRPRTDGALLPFADRLWFTPYRTDAAGDALEGGGLYEIDQDMKFVKRAESLPGVFANRKMVAGLLSIGPHLIDADGRVRTIKALEGRHVVSSIRDPKQREKMCLLTVDGRLLQVDLKTLAVEQLADVPRELGLSGAGLCFKAGHQADGRIFVTAVAPDGRSGCLAEWDGKDWRTVDRRAFGEVADWASMSQTVVATGWDRASAILKIRSAQGWDTYRLPKADPGYDTAWRSAWPRIREVETERILMDVHGIFYETTGLGYAWFVRPITTHNRLVSDFCSWRGMLVMAGNDPEARSGSNYVRGGDGVGLWFGKTDDLWRFGRPTGEGGPWLRTEVRAEQASEPYLMTNFRNKRIELSHDSDQPVQFSILVDVLGTRRSWKVYRKVTVEVGKKVTHEFPDGFSAHWVRVKVDRDCRATAWLIYD